MSEERNVLAGRGEGVENNGVQREGKWIPLEGRKAVPIRLSKEKKRAKTPPPKGDWLLTAAIVLSVLCLIVVLVVALDLRELRRRHAETKCALMNAEKRIGELAEDLARTSAAQRVLVQDTAQGLRSEITEEMQNALKIVEGLVAELTSEFGSLSKDLSQQITANTKRIEANTRSLKNNSAFVKEMRKMSSTDIGFLISGAGLGELRRTFKELTDRVEVIEAGITTLRGQIQVLGNDASKTKSTVDALETGFSSLRDGSIDLCAKEITVQKVIVESSDDTTQPRVEITPEDLSISVEEEQIARLGLERNRAGTSLGGQVRLSYTGGARSCPYDEAVAIYEPRTAGFLGVASFEGKVSAAAKAYDLQGAAERN